MRNVLVLLLCLAFLFGNAQSNVPVSTLPGVDSLGQNDFFPVVQGGHYHKAYIWQLPSGGGGCVCQPSGSTGYVQYNGSGVWRSDSLFTRNAVTGATTIAYYDTGQYKVGEQIDNIAGFLNGAANQIYQASSGNYAISGVVDGSTLGGAKTMAVMGVGNLKTFQHNGFWADTGGADILTDSFQLDINHTGISFNWNNGSYTFPKSTGVNGQVLTTNGAGILSWQSVGDGAPGDTSGSVPYAGAKSEDSLFTRNPTTLQTTIAYYDSSQVKIGEQIGKVVGVFNGAASQMYQPATGDYAISGVIDATPYGGAPLTAVTGIINTAANTVQVFSADTAGVQMQYDSSHLGIGKQGLYYYFNGGDYIFPNSEGTNKQVLATNGSGGLTWQNTSYGFPGGSLGLVQYSSESGSDTLFTRNPLTLATTIGYDENGFKIGEQLQNVLSNLNGAANQMYEPASRNYAVNGVIDLTSHGMGMTAMMGFVNGTDTFTSVLLADSFQAQVKFGKTYLQLDSAGFSYKWQGGSYIFPQANGSNGQVLTTDSVGNLSWQNTSGSNVQTAHVTVSSSQILNMVSSPIQLLPAPGSGKFIQVLSITGKLNFNSTAYLDTPAVSYGGSYNTDIAAYFDTANTGLYNTPGLLLSTHTLYSVFSTANASGNFAVDNAPLMLTVYDGGPIPTNPYGGDGTMDIYITYTIVTE